jgi:hypothetical protein
MNICPDVMRSFVLTSLPNNSVPLQLVIEVFAPLAMLHNSPQGDIVPPCSCTLWDGMLVVQLRLAIHMQEILGPQKYRKICIVRAETMPKRHFPSAAK